jgi:hypothetical protein
MLWLACVALWALCSVLGVAYETKRNETTRANDLANELARMEADAAECGYDGD